MEKDELDYEIDCIDRQITALQMRRRELADKSDERFLKYARRNVGRCFRFGGQFAKVIGVPSRTYFTGESSLNRYQYPAVFINPDGDSPFPIEYDTIFSGAWEGYSDPNDRQYEEISSEEFDRAFTDFLGKVKREIEAIHKEGE